MYELGQIVRIREGVAWAKNIGGGSGIGRDDYFKITYIYKTRREYNIEKRYPILIYLQVTEDEIESVDTICPVCNQEAGKENNKIKKHEHDGKICYGSFTPVALDLIN